MLTGRVKLRTGVKSYGFISPDRGQGLPRGDVFFHASQFIGCRPEHDALVEFELGEHDGRRCAVNIRHEAPFLLIHSNPAGLGPLYFPPLGREFGA